MSLPIKPNPIEAVITLTATQAENLVNNIQRLLTIAKEAQEKDPTLHWNGVTIAEHKAFGLISDIHMGDHVRLRIAPDKRHEGCSGYCHY